MKKLTYILIAGIVWCLSSCKDMDSIYQDYIVPNGHTYPGKALNPIVYAGKNRVKVSWLKGSDPKVVRARVYWNNYTDSTDVNVPADKDTISCIIEDLPENTYSFFIRTFDEKGNISIPVEVRGSSYGVKYEAGILNRAINNAILTETTVKIEWGTIDTLSAYATEIRYTNATGEIQTLRTMSNEAVSTISDIKRGTTFSYRTLYVPNHLAIDTFYTGFLENKEYFLNKSVWRIIGFSTQHSGAANLASNVIDGNPATRWHTHATASNFPHFVTVDMGIDRTITAFKIFRATSDDRAFDTFQLFSSTDNANWIDLGVFRFNRFIDDGQYYAVPPTSGRYFKFVGLSGPNKFMVTGEINAYGL